MSRRSPGRRRLERESQGRGLTLCGLTVCGSLRSRRFARFAMALVLLAGFAAIGLAQSSPGPGAQSYPRSGQWGQMQPDQSYPGQIAGDPAMEAKRLNALNAERQKAMVADTDKLVKLAAELNEEVNGGTPSRLTEEQLRKVAEIEKLARSIREKMATSVRPAPSMMDPPAVMPNMR